MSIANIISFCLFLFCFVVFFVVVVVVFLIVLRVFCSLGTFKVGSILRVEVLSFSPSFPTAA